MRINKRVGIKIPVAKPVLGEREAWYLNEALRQGAISGLHGEFLERFEQGFAEYCECRYGVATTSGTTALHLALAALGIGTGDEVLVSTFTNMATFFAVCYQGARPIPLDIEEDTWNIDPRLLEPRITPRTKAVLVVHVYGHPVDMDPVLEIARKHDLYVIEDAAEAHGATYKNKKVGSLGHVGCFSFYANKILTTGEGGMVTTNDASVAARARLLRGLAYGSKDKFMHEDIGFNYRMTNLQAAIGCAQLERIEEIIANKRRIAGWYSVQLKEVPEIQLPVEKPYAKNVFWMYHIVLQEPFHTHRDEIMRGLLERGIETREAFIPYNLQNIFISKGWVKPEECPVANRIAGSGLYMPSSADLSEIEVDDVAYHLVDIIRSLRR